MRRSSLRGTGMPTKSSSKTSKADEKANAYHAADMVAASRIVGAMSKAEQGIAEDIKALLKAFQYKGGFKTVEEAQRYLDKPLTAMGKKMLMTKATKLPKSMAKKYIARLGADSVKAAITHKEAVKMVIDMNQPELLKAIQGQADPFLKKTITEAYGRQSFEIQKGMNIAYNLDMPTTGSIREIASSALPKSTTTSLANQVTEDIRAQIIEMMLQGKSTYDIAKKVAEGTGTEVWKAKRLVRTIITEASAEAELKALDDAGFDEYEYIATKDEKTCPVCGRLDGRKYKLKSKKVGINCPPIHPNCRCTIGTVMEDWEKEGQVKAAKDEKGKNITIPADWTYEDWAKQYYKKGYEASKKVSLKLVKSTVSAAMTAPNPPKVGKMTVEPEKTTVKAPEAKPVKPEKTAEPVKTKTTFSRPSISSLRKGLDDLLSKVSERFPDYYRNKDVSQSLNNKKKVLDYMEDPEKYVEAYKVMDPRSESYPEKKADVESVRKNSEFLFGKEAPRILKDETYTTSINEDYSKWQGLSEKFEKSLSDDERKAIADFTGSFYTSSNSLMRGTDVEEEYVVRKAALIGQALDRSEMPAFAAYRGVSDPALMLGMNVDDLEVGDTFLVPEFMSTTTRMSKARDFANLSTESTESDSRRNGKIFRIEAPATKGVAAPIKSMSNYQNENEILLNRNTIFEFAGKEVVEWKNLKITVYRLKIVG